MNNKHLINLHEGRKIAIISAASSVKTYYKQISRYLKKNECLTIGVNVMSHIFVPYYHVWTNKKHFSKYGNTIASKSIPIFASSIPRSLIKKHVRKKYLLIHYDSSINKCNEFKIDESGLIYGNCRTAGNLSIVIANIMGASQIDVFGMDGYTYFSKDELNSGASQHCYGVGHNDDYSWKQCLQKDKEINEWLHSIREYGISFVIKTPTIYSDFAEDWVSC